MDSLPRSCLLCGNRFNIKLMELHRKVFMCNNFRKSVGKRRPDCFLCQSGADVTKTDLIRCHKMVSKCFKRHYCVNKSSSQTNSNLTLVKSGISAAAVIQVKTESVDHDNTADSSSNGVPNKMNEVPRIETVLSNKNKLNNDRFRCPECSVFFNFSRHLQQHVKIIHIRRSQQKKIDKSSRNSKKIDSVKKNATPPLKPNKNERPGSAEPVSKRRKGIPKKKSIQGPLENFSNKISKGKFEKSLTKDSDEEEIIQFKKGESEDNEVREQPSEVENIVYTISKFSDGLRRKRKMKIYRNDRKLIQTWTDNQMKMRKTKSVSFAELRSVQGSKNLRVTASRPRRKSTLDKSEEQKCRRCKELLQLNAAQRMERHHLLHCVAKVIIRQAAESSLNNASNSIEADKNLNTVEDLIDMENGGSVLCKICGKASMSFRLLKQHIKIAHCETEHRCQHCNKSFKSENLLNNHVTLSHSTKRAKCKFCREKLENRYELKRHLRSAHNLSISDYSKKTSGKDIRNILKTNIDSSLIWNNLQSDGTIKTDISTSKPTSATALCNKPKTNVSHGNISFEGDEEVDSKDSSLEFLEELNVDEIGSNDQEIFSFFDVLDLEGVDDLPPEMLDLDDSLLDPSCEKMELDEKMTAEENVSLSSFFSVRSSVDEGALVKDEATEEELTRQISLLMENREDLLAVIDGLSVEGFDVSF